MSDQSQERKAPAIKGPGTMRVLDAEVLDGFTVNQLKCRSCSGYGNCGFKSYFLNPEGKGIVSICMQRREQLQNKRKEGTLDA